MTLGKKWEIRWFIQGCLWLIVSAALVVLKGGNDDVQFSPDDGRYNLLAVAQPSTSDSGGRDDLLAADGDFAWNRQLATPTPLPNLPAVATANPYQVERCYAATRSERSLTVCLISVVFQEQTGWAYRCFTSESNLSMAAVGAAGEVGIAQLYGVHRERAEKLGYTWQQVATEPMANLLVAQSIYEEQGATPWNWLGC